MVAYNSKSILGEGGIGKTSTMAHLALDWADDQEDILKQFKLVFLIHLNLVAGKDKTLEEIITEQHDELNGMEDLIHSQLQDPNGNVLLILDGLDEYAMGTNTVIDNIIYQRSNVVLSKKLIIITSRSEAENLHLIAKQINKVVVAKGFSEENVVQCVENLFKSDKKDSEVDDFLHRDILGLLRVPIILYMAFLLHQENTELSMPSSKTEIIGDIVDLIMDRKKSRRLTEEEKKALKIQVGKKAWAAAQKGIMVLQKV